MINVLVIVIKDNYRCIRFIGIIIIIVYVYTFATIMGGLLNADIVNPQH